jgi:hypothetical protein
MSKEDVRFFREISRHVDLIFSVIGMYGAIWVITMYVRGKVLKNTIGSTIMALAIIDLLHSFALFGSGIGDMLYLAKMMSKETFRLINIVWNVAFMWSMLSASQLTLTMVGQVLYLLFGGSLLRIQKYRFALICSGILLPLGYWFLPYYVIFDGFDFLYARSSARIMNVIISIVVIISLMLLVTVWIRYRTLVKAASIHSRRSSHRIYRLIIVYFISTVIIWTPWMIRNWMIWYSEDQSRKLYCSTLTLCGIFVLFKNITIASRGYIHAAAVYYVYKLQQKPKNILLGIGRSALLLDLDSTVTENESDEATDFKESSPTLRPEWSVTLPENESINVSVDVTRTRNLTNGD